MNTYNYGNLIESLNNGNFAISEKIAHQILATNTRDITALKVLIYINIQRSKFDKAISMVEISLSIDPNSSEIAYFGAVSYLRSGRLEEAKKMLTLAGKLHPVYSLVNELKNILELHESSAANENLKNIANKFNLASFKYDEGREKVAYDTPELIFKEVRRLKPIKYNSVLDLGCGTGLSGVLFRKHTDYLIGIDLSIEMMTLALDKKIYNELNEIDIFQFLKNSESNQYDVIIAASVFIYFGDLSDLFIQIQRVLNHDGVICFDLNSDGNEDFYSVFSVNGLQFQHGKNYIMSCAKKAGLHFQNIIDSNFQYLKIGEPHPGQIYSFSKNN